MSAEPGAAAEAARAPAARRRARARGRLARIRRRGRRAARRERLRRVRRGRRARRPRARGRAQAQAQLRARAHARGAASRAPSGSRRWPSTPACRGRCSPTSASCEVKQRAGRRRAARGSGASRASSSSEIVPALEQWRYRNKLEYSFGGGSGERARVRLSRLRGRQPRAGRSRTACSPPSAATSRASSRCAGAASRACSAVGARRGATAPRRAASGARRASAPRGVGRRRRARAAAQPRRARGQAHRQAAGAARDDRRASSRRARSRRRSRRGSASSSAACCGRARGASPRRPRAATPSSCGARRELPERLGELDLRSRRRRSSRPTPRWPRCSTARSSEYAALEGWERVYDLYCGIGTIALTLAPRAGELWGIELSERRSPTRSPRRGATRSTNAHFFAGDVRLRCASCSSAPGGPTWSSSTRRARGSPRRSCTASSKPRRGGSSTCRATPPRSRPTPPNSSQAGWALRRVRPVDMFPQTHHIECVALLERT